MLETRACHGLGLEPDCNGIRLAFYRTNEMRKPYSNGDLNSSIVR